MNSSSSRPRFQVSSSSKQDFPSQSTNNNFLNNDSSPFQSSPISSSPGGMSSPRLFWQVRDHSSPSRLNTENIYIGNHFNNSPRRSSIEKLQRASPVKNSSIFAREQKLKYDPTLIPQIVRPFKKSLQGNAYSGSGLGGYRINQPFQSPDPAQNASTGNKEDLTNWKQQAPDLNVPKNLNTMGLNTIKGSIKDQPSPTKSSLSATRSKSNSMSDVGSSSDSFMAANKQLPPGRNLKRHAKSVTFDEAPPQINEYEMATPDLSSIGTESRENSYESEDEEFDNSNYNDTLENDNSFDASLEDTEKTPVVGPEDWQNERTDDLVDGFITGEIDDPYDIDADDSLNDVGTSSKIAWSSSRTGLWNSNAEQRPLPPIPGDILKDRLINSSPSMDVAWDCRGSQNSSPLPSSVFKGDIKEFEGCKMTLEERLNLMMTGDDDIPSVRIENQRERRMRRAGARERSSHTPERSSQTPERNSSSQMLEEKAELDDLSSPEMYQLPHRISRESILRKINGDSPQNSDPDYIFSSPLLNSGLNYPTFPDPDTPIQSTEKDDVDENKMDEEGNGVCIKQEIGEESEINLYDLPELSLGPCGKLDDEDDKSSLSSQESESQYSEDTPTQSLKSEIETDDCCHNQSETLNNATQEKSSEKPTRSPSLQPTLSPEAPRFDVKQFRLSLQTSPRIDLENESKECSASGNQSISNCSEETLPQRATCTTPENNCDSPESDQVDDEREKTPESVIHHQIFYSSPPESPSIPEEIATIKSAAGSHRLKTRPSITSGDFQLIKEGCSEVNDDIPDVPDVPAIPENCHDQSLSGNGPVVANHENNSSFKRSLTLDFDNNVSLDLENDFDRVVRAQKIGYLTRQNTKIVIATSNNDLHDVFYSNEKSTNSTLKQPRSQSWVVEPWISPGREKSEANQVNDPSRPSSTTQTKKTDQRRTTSGTSRLSDFSSFDDSSERGRLFVKVLGVKELDLPLPRNEKTWFNLTLDNGVHCVTTAWLELGKNAPIGQEFELIVPNELEFQLTLNAKLIKPLPKKVSESSVKGFKVHKPSTFSKVFTSPKKRKEIEARHRQEEQRYALQKEMELQAKRSSVEPTAWDLLSPYAADDGSFGRSYVCLKDYESSCYGRPFVVEVSCFNEWATESISNSSSVISKRSSTHIQRRAPYKVAKLALQLLFVPKPKHATDEDMPKSMNSCIREMKEAEKAMAHQWEGYMSQQGGDCPYWRRRYFKLSGNKLTAYHETSRQPRVTINLCNARKIIDDRSVLTQRQTTGRGGKQRISGFAEDEEGYMFVEEGFRIRFNNGEVIDFYAESSADKESWLNVLEKSINSESTSTKKSWCRLVLKREESLRRRAEKESVGMKRMSAIPQRTKCPPDTIEV